MKEDEMDRIIERHGRLIGLILIVAALVGGGIFYYTMNDPKPQESYSIKEKHRQHKQPGNRKYRRDPTERAGMGR